MTASDEKSKPPFAAWQERLEALKNVPPVLKIVWEAGPYVVTLGLIFRVLVALIPVSAG